MVVVFVVLKDVGVVLLVESVLVVVLVVPAQV
jgi:hypothetical protein